MTQKEKDIIFIDFTRGHFGEHQYSEKLKNLHSAYKDELTHYRGCGACHKRRVTASYKTKVMNLLNSE